MVYGKYVRLLHSTFRNGSRCIIWIRSSTSSTPSNPIVDGCTFKGASNHYPIEFMPSNIYIMIEYIDSAM